MPGTFASPPLSLSETLPEINDVGRILYSLTIGILNSLTLPVGLGRESYTVCVYWWNQRGG